MTNTSERDHFATSPLAGLVPSRLRQDADAARTTAAPSRVARGVLSTMPVVLVGSLALATMNLTGTVEAKAATPSDGHSSDRVSRGVERALATATASSAPAAAPAAASIEASSVPSHYTVRGGDTVSSIAVHHGLSTASVLALNGLSWKSIIFPGQVLKLVKGGGPHTSARATHTGATASKGRYTVRKGDTISSIARTFGVAVHSLLSANGLSLSSIIYAGRTIAIPSASTAATGVSVPVVAPTPPVASDGTYTVAAGDTITSIAKKFTVSVQSILDANVLGASSIIYAGRKLIIPSTQTASVGGVSVPLSPAMRANAATIVSVGKRLGVSSFGIVVALAAAAQESGLVDLPQGDRDSVGLFQQRPSQGWGTAAQLLDTTHAAELFFGGASNPNKGVTRGLLDVPGWQTMTLTAAAQAVQVSAYPTAYAKWETSARAWYSELA